MQIKKYEIKKQANRPQKAPIKKNHFDLSKCLNIKIISPFHLSK